MLCNLQSKLNAAVPQNHGILVAPKVHKSMSFVDWKLQSAEEIERAWRALSDWFHLSTSILLHLPVNAKHSKESVSTEVAVGLKERPVVLYPVVTDETNYSSVRVHFCK